MRVLQISQLTRLHNDPLNKVIRYHRAWRPRAAAQPIPTPHRTRMHAHKTRTHPAIVLLLARHMNHAAACSNCGEKALKVRGRGGALWRCACHLFFSSLLFSLLFLFATASHSLDMSAPAVGGENMNTTVGAAAAAIAIVYRLTLPDLSI